LASTKEVIEALGAFFKRKGIDSERMTEPVSIPFGQDPLMWWLTVCEDGTIVGVSKALHQVTLQRNPWTTDVRGEKLESLSFRGKEVYRTVMRQIALFKKEEKPNRCLVPTANGRYFGNLYPIEQVFPGQSCCNGEVFIWVLSGFDQDHRHLAEQDVENLEMLKLM
jgi:hypothetical protein